MALLALARVVPNFVCSVGYLFAAGAKVEEEKGALVVRIPGDVVGEWEILLPPVGMARDVYGKGEGVVFPSAEILWDFEGYDPGPGYVREFWDHEFIYDPYRFNDLSGGNWKVFRKNVRRFERTHAPLHVQASRTKVYGFWLEWLESQEGTYIDDLDAINNYLITGQGYRSALEVDGKLVGVNVWDENYKYINFRYCFSLPEYKYANEFQRLTFYTSPRVTISGKQVNDGGSLGSQSLYRFKSKLNPVEIRERFSWQLGRSHGGKTD